MGELDDSKLLHIWTEVHLGRGRHGGFLRAFSEAYVRATADNLPLIEAAAQALVVKYSLDQYLDNYRETDGPIGIVR